MRYLFSIIVLLVFLSTALSADSTGSLRVHISGIDAGAGGVLRVAIFKGSQHWPKFKGATQVIEAAAEQAEQMVVFENLSYADDYAVEVHHDENGNGKFDMRWLPYPKPKEGVGVSNNKIGFGSPEFSSARFSLQSSEKIIQIRMSY